jgi:diacylglycerol O-acyltransferase / wax synthase
MERMSSLDAVFIAVEDAVNHMHIGSVGIFEGPAPSYGEVRALVAAKLQLIPRYRQRVREAPASIGRPLWIDDVHFDLDYHLRHTALPAGDRFALERLVGRVMSHPLDRQRPLWEMWLIEGLGDDRWALLSKVHHCMVDGIAGSDLLALIMDLDPNAAQLTSDEWSPAPEPSRVELARYAANMAIGSTLTVARDGVHALRHPADALDRARDVAIGVGRTILPGRRGGSSLTGAIGPHRRWAHTRVSIDDVKAIRDAFGGTVNDVVLAAVTRGFRELLRARGEDVDGRTITALVPVSMRSADARGTLDNRVSAVYARLPIGIDDPVETLLAIHEHMDQLKASHEIDASAAIVGVGDLAPPVLAAALARALVHGQEMVQTITTNVPGPQVPLYMCSRRMLEAYPYVPIAGHVRVSVAIWSYCGDLYFGITGDWHGAPDVDRLPREIDIGFEDLLKEAASAIGQDS